MIEEIEGTKLKLFNGKKFDLLEIFNIDPEDLSTSFMQQASLYAYFATLEAEAERRLAIAKFDLEQERAASDEDFRNELTRSDKKFTEAVIKSLVDRDEQVASKTEIRINLEYDVNLLHALVLALSQRANMLVSLGAMTRQELAMTGMTMKDREYDGLPNELKTIINQAKKRRDQV